MGSNGCGPVETVKKVSTGRHKGRYMEGHSFYSYRSRSRSHRLWLPEALLRLLIFRPSTGKGSEIHSLAPEVSTNHPDSGLVVIGSGTENLQSVATTSPGGVPDERPSEPNKA